MADVRNNYNIPSNNRELQRRMQKYKCIKDYNIPSNNRELQPRIKKYVLAKIITYQVITGNYSSFYIYWMRGRL